MDNSVFKSYLCIVSGVLISLFSTASIGFIYIPTQGKNYHLSKGGSVILVEEPRMQLATPIPEDVKNTHDHDTLGDPPPLTNACIFESKNGIFKNTDKKAGGGNQCRRGTKLEELSGSNFVVYFEQPYIKGRYRYKLIDGSINSSVKGHFEDNGNAVVTQPYMFCYNKSRNIIFKVEGYKITNDNYGTYLGTVVRKYQDYPETYKLSTRTNQA